MQLKSPEDQAALLRRSKELDAKEEYLESIKAALDKGPMTIKVYEAQVTAKQEQLAQLTSQIAAADSKLTDMSRLVSKEYDQFTLTKQEYEHQLSEQLEQIDTLQRQVKELRTLLKETQGEIDERHKYQKDQEKQIEQSSMEGNEQLLELNSQVAKLKHEIQILTTDKLDLKPQVDDLIIRTGELQSIYDQTKSGLEAEVKQLEAQIITTREGLVSETSRYKEIGEEVDEKLSILKEKEESIIAKRDAVRLARQELDQDKRRWESKKAILYGNDL
jgi:chromosome segregation ATPase